VYCRLLRWKTPSQNFCTLLTTPTIRQSSRVFASSPVRQLEMSEGVSTWPGWPACPTVCWSSGASCPRPLPAAGEQRDQEPDDQGDDPEPAAAEGDAAGPAMRRPRRSVTCPVSSRASLRKRITGLLPSGAGAKRD
jgi:hypothetical protein